MKVSYVVPFVALASGLVLPSENLRDIKIEDYRRSPCLDKFLSEKDRLLDNSRNIIDNYYDEAADATSNAWSQVRHSFNEAFENTAENVDSWKDDFFEKTTDVRSWINSESHALYDSLADVTDQSLHKPDNKPNMTVYQIIAGNKYSTKLAALINKFDDLVEALNSTKSNYTVFAPTDKALDKIPEHAPKPSKEQLKEFLSYHVVPDLYPAGRVLFAHTAPTLLKSKSLAKEPMPQRIAFRLGWKGVTINFYSAVVAPNIFATNGVIHAIDTPLFPPIGAIREIDLFPGAFSTLELGLAKTGLLDELNTTDHAGGTLFAPNNHAFEKLGPKANAFLFSKYGIKYLKALLEYHVAPENTLYSDAFYKGKSSEAEDVDATKGTVHVDLPTALKDRSLSIDIARYGPIYVMKINGFNRVAVQDVVAEDGVIHVMKEVIIPPRKAADGQFEYWEGGEFTVEELTERLEPFVDHDFKDDL